MKQNSLFQTFLEKVNSFEAQDGEDDGTGVDGGEGIADREDDDVLDAVLLGIVVRSEADDGAKSQAEGVEHLIGRVKPHCRLQQHLHLGGEHVGEPLRRPVQRDPAEEEDGQDEVGEEGGEVHYLTRARDTLGISMLLIDFNKKRDR